MTSVKMNINKIIFSIFYLVLANNIYGQVVIREPLNFLIVTDRKEIPKYEIPFYYDTELKSEVMEFDTFRNWKQSEQVQNYISSWKTKNNITDDGNKNFYFGVFRRGSDYFVKKVIGTIKYMLEEPAVEKKIFVEQNLFDEIICLFKPVVNLSEIQLNPILIKPLDPNSFLRFAVSKDNVLEKNVRFKFEFKNQDYVLKNEAGLLKEDWGDSYFNLKLSLSDNTGKTQILIMYPSIIEFDITGITILDIDNDEQPDFIISIIDETCTRRIIYLSGGADKNQFVKYVGFKTISCVSP